MNFTAPLVEGRLIQRYKRFMADVELADGTVVTAAVANTGAMLGVKTPGSRVWLLPANNPKRKLPWDWMLIEIDNTLVGISTAIPNRIVKEALLEHQISELDGYETVQSEQKVGNNSRIDFVLSGPKYLTTFVEVKNVHLCRTKGLAEFPDSQTARGVKHLQELMQLKADGHRAVMLYVVQWPGCERMGFADDLDPLYAQTAQQAYQAGVTFIAYSCKISLTGISLAHSIPIHI